ncbi:MAG: hypothetical protein QG584_1999 [Pseudomonadota bacterium]|nr:hypothetical protein [Pseudomonadota bacterium]
MNSQNLRASKNLRPGSLRQRLLTWLLPGVAVLLLASGVGSYYVASNNATQAYDRSLLNLALALANQAQFKDGEVRFDLQPQARQILLTDKFDEIRYAVYGPRGRLLSGDEGLFPGGDLAADKFEDGHLFFDGHGLKGRPVRGVILLAPVESAEITVVITETLTKREMQVGDILLSVLVPELLLFAATIALVLRGVDAGLRPLEGLRIRLGRRTPVELKPLGVDGVPFELRPLVREIDQLLGRLGTALGAQRHFVSDAAHQLRTPIAALLAQLESTMLESGDPRLEQLRESVQRLVRLVNQLLALARAEPGSMPAQQLDLRTLIEGEADAWLQMALARDIDLGFELVSAPAQGIALLLAELLGNLVDNAIRYTPRGGRVTVRCGSEAGCSFVAVDDNGPGVPPELRERIFERLFRGDTGSAGGSGLGLAIVRQIAAQQGASIQVGESVDGGASFVVFFAAPPGI